MMNLAEHYRAIRGPADADDHQLEQTLRGAIARARAQHPDLALDDATFVEFLAARIDLDRCQSYLGDLFVACACASGVPGAVERLEALCVSQIPYAIARIDRAPEFVTEIQQRVREKLVIGGAD